MLAQRCIRRTSPKARWQTFGSPTHCVCLEPREAKKSSVSRRFHVIYRPRRLSSPLLRSAPGMLHRLYKSMYCTAPPVDLRWVGVIDGS